MITKPTRYSKKLVREICKLVSEDEYTIAELCNNVGISERLFYRWKKDKSEFADAIKEADKIRLKLFKVEARKSVLKKIKGYEYEETHMTASLKKGKGKDKENGEADKLVIKEQKKTKKHVPPDSILLMYVLNNTDPENFKHKSHTELTGKGGGPVQIYVLPDGTKIKF